MFRRKKITDAKVMMESLCSAAVALAGRIPRPGVVAALLATLLFSANSALAKLLSQSGSHSPFQVLYFRGVTTLIGCSLLLAKDVSLPLPHQRRLDICGWAVLRGLLGTLAIGSLYFALAQLPLTEAVVLYSLNPVFAAIFSRLLLCEPVTVFRVVGSVLLLGGVIMSVAPARSVSLSTSDSTGWVARAVAVFGALCAGTSVVCARKMSVEKSHWTSQAWWQGAVAACIAPLTSGFIAFSPFQSGSANPALMLGMGLCALFGQLAIGVAIQLEDAAVIGVLWNFDICFSFFWQSVLFKSPVTWYQGVSIAMVVIASVITVSEKFFRSVDAQQGDTDGPVEVGPVLPATPGDMAVLTAVEMISNPLAAQPPAGEGTLLRDLEQTGVQKDAEEKSAASLILPRPDGG